jgi:hypothetical protein
VIVETPGNTTFQNFADDRQEGNRSVIFNGLFKVFLVNGSNIS